MRDRSLTAASPIGRLPAAWAGRAIRGLAPCGAAPMFIAPAGLVAECSVSPPRLQQNSTGYFGFSLRKNVSPECATPAGETDGISTTAGRSACSTATGRLDSERASCTRPAGYELVCFWERVSNSMALLTASTDCSPCFFGYASKVTRILCLPGSSAMFFPPWLSHPLSSRSMTMSS